MNPRISTRILSLVVALIVGCGESTQSGLSPDAAADDRVATLTTVAAMSTATTLEVCKVAGTGVATGATFSVAVTRDGVARTIAVHAGGCTQVAIPVLGAPLGKGAYANRPGLVVAVLPPGATLTVGGAALDASQASSILGGSRSVKASSALLLNLAQQLIAARLNMLQGIVPTSVVLNAIGGAQAALVVASGSPIMLTSSFSAAALSPMVDALTRFNEGKAGSAATFAQIEVDEDVPSGTIVAIACTPSTQCTNADIGAGKVTARVDVGGMTRVTFTNSVVPTLTVCQVAGPGVAAGQSYKYGYAVPLGGGVSGELHVPAGECVDQQLPTNSYQLFQYLPDAEVVTSIDCEPASRCTSTSTSTLSAYADLVAGSNTRITFTNQSTLGTVRVCKLGTGLGTGTTFRFQAVMLAAGPSEDPFGTEVFVAPGDCQDAKVPVGRYHVFEDVPTGTVLTDITCAPVERCERVDVDIFSAFLNITSGMTTTVTFTNAPAGGD